VAVSVVNAAERRGTWILGNVMSRPSIIAFAVVISLLFGGCAAPRSELPETLAVPQIEPKISQAELDNLLIGPADLLEVSVFGVPELDGRYQVDYLGRIKMPLVGEVNAMGLSTYELSDLLEQKLGETYLQDPDVNIVVAESMDSGREITVEGSVAKPGLYPVDTELTLLQAIALAGGPSDTANPSRVVVFRTIDGERTAAGFDLLKIREGVAEDPQVFSNDIIVMDGSEARRNYREFLRSIPLLALFIAL